MMAIFASLEFSIGVSVLILLSPLMLKKNQTVSSLSGLTTTFGILGTFIGIFIGLIAFKTDNLEVSVPALLEGLKTAFLTSITGMIAGVLLKIWPQLYGIKVSEGGAKEGIEAMVSMLGQIKNGIDRSAESQAAHLKAIERSLCGDGDSTLLTQMQKMRASFNDKQDELISEFRTFAQMMVQNNTKALIDALTDVMKDFNAKINEQFGDNFKQLNQAVERILVWQENYKEQVEAMVLAFEKALEGVERSDENLASINKHADKFNQVAESTKALHESLEQKIEITRVGLAELADVAAEAKSALPMIKNEVNELTTEFANTVSAALQEISETIDVVNQRVKDQSNALNESQMVLATSLTQMMRDIGERITDQVSALDDALSKELQQSLQSLSRQLVSLSNRFVEDYEPLTERLRDVVQIAQRIRN